MAGLEKFGSPVKVQRIGNDSVYGTGSDGTVIIASNTSLTRDMYYNNLTINNGSHLNTNGYKVFVKNTLTVNGSIGVSDGVSVSNATLTGTPAIGTSVTNSIGGNAAGVTYTASQVSSDVRSYIENILMGASVSGSGTVSAFTGGAGGGNGVAGTVTPATAGTGATNGAAGTAGTGATNGAAGTAGTGATAGGAGGAGDLGPHRNVLAPGGNGSAGTPGTNGAAGSAGSAGTNGAAGAAGTNGTNGAAGSTPPAALAGTGARGGAVVLVCAKSITGSGSIVSLGSHGGLGGNAATGSGATNGTAGTGATSGTAGANGSGATAGGAGAAGSAGTAAPGQAVAHHVNSHAHIISGDGTHGAHVQVPSPALPRGHVAAAHGQHAHGYYTATHHGATPVHPANHHGGSSPTYGSASTTHAHVAPSGYYHQNSIPHNAGGHLGHDGAVAHGESGSVEFGNHSYHEADAHHYQSDLKHGAHSVTHASRPRTDHAGHHYNGDHRRAGDQRHVGHAHKAGGAAGSAGAAGTSGTPGTNGAAGTSGTPGTNGAAGTNGTNGSTTAGTNGQSGGGGGIFIITDSTPTGVTTSVSGGTIEGVSANSGNVITVLNA